MATENIERAPTRAEKLTKAFVEKLACPESGDFSIYDSEQPGLALRLSPGSKTWIVRRKLRGKSFRHVLGRFPTMTLDAARREAKKAIGAFEEGKHPTLERESRKAATNAEWLATRFTVGEMWAEYRNQDRGNHPFSSNTERDFKRVETWLKSDPLFATPIATLSEVETRAAFKRAGHAASKNPRASNGGKTTANLIFRNLRTATQYAIRHKRLAAGSNVFSAALELSWHAPRPRTRTLDVDKDSLKRWWEALDVQRAKGNANAKNRSSAILADFQALVLLWGGRRGETLQLRWDDVDFERKIVTFPADVTKARRVHIFPLAPLAESILRRLESLRDSWSPGSEWVFPATKAGRVTKKKTHIQEPAKAMREVAAAAKVPFSTHDIRRTFSNLLASAAGVGAELTFVKLAMNHSVADDVTASHYLDKAEQLRPHYEALENVVLEKVGVAVPKRVMVDAAEYQRFIEFQTQSSKPRRRTRAPEA